MNGIILFADNKIFEDGHENELFKLFRQNTDYSVLPIETLPCLEETIKSATTFKACIIDWNFTDSDDFNEDFGEDFKVAFIIECSQAGVNTVAVE